MIQALFEALPQVLDPSRLGWVLVGTFTGLLVGILPGLGGIVGMSLLLPLVYGMDPFVGISLLIGMVAVVTTSDTFPSVLIGTPGSAGSQATVMDGYPMARRGEAKRALGAGFSASMFGGIIAAFIMLGLLLVARPLVLSLRSPHLFMLSVLGLATVGTLVRSSPMIGVLSATFGVMIGFVGAAPGSPTYRFVFDTLYLWQGVPIGILALSLFAIPELVDLLAKGTSIADKSTRGGAGILQGIRDSLSNKFLILRHSALGVAIGMLPGLGASVVDWISYGLAKQTVKDERFGQGDVRGVIAPESSNNAKEAGAMVPSLLFGIPGSATSAMLLGGLLLMGVEVGPRMVTEHLPLTLTIIWTLVIANIFGTIACILLVRPLSGLTTLPVYRLVPILLVIITIAAYQSRRHWGDIVVLLVLGLVGWMMKRTGWPRAPMIVGAVLAPNIERYLMISSSRYGASWLLDPGVLALAVCVAGVLYFGLRKTRSRDKEVISNAETASS